MRLNVVDQLNHNLLNKANTKLLVLNEIHGTNNRTEVAANGLTVGMNGIRARWRFVCARNGTKLDQLIVI